MHHLRAVAAFLSLALAATAPAPGAAQPSVASPDVDPQRLAGLAEFVDGVVAQQIASREVAGAVVTVVRNGAVLFSRGYGFADVDRRIPVDAETTMFRPGSVSKMFTWTALMQQVEQGRVRLDADVNDYFDFRIPPFAGKPILVRDLLSHSPGMSDVGNFSAPSADRLVPYQSWIKAHVPSRLWAPGTEISYSNYGAALAGYIVERVSGEPFPDYVERHLFAPLGMRSTSFREPLPPALAGRMALGYRIVDGRFIARPYELYSAIMPAGSAATSAPDMARFMLAILGDGMLGEGRILSPDSVRLLESNSRANAAHLSGMAHGFIVTRDAGPRLIGHAGNTGDFHSNLILAPEAKLGFFVSTTGGPGSYAARTELSDAIIGRLFPQPPTPRWNGAGATPPTGAYRVNRRDYNRPADPKNDLKVAAVPGARAVTTEAEGRRIYWEQIGPGLYEQVTGARAGGPYDRIEFYRAADGPRLSFASQPYAAYHLVEP